MIRAAAAVVLVASLAVFCRAQDTKWEPPGDPQAGTPPAGWKAAVSKDGTYRYAVPPGVGRSGTRDHTYRFAGVSIRSQGNYYTLKDGTTFEVGFMVPSGSALKGKTYGEVMDAIVTGMEQDGEVKVSARKDVTVGKIKAREYRVTNEKEKTAWRMVLFAAKPRVYLLNVAADDPARLDAEAANSFLSSLVLVPPEVVKAQAKEKAAKDEAAGKENQEKYGVKWTTKLDEMTPPSAPAVGVIRGKEFKPEKVELQPGGWLVFRQGEKGAFADVEVKLWLVPKAGESPENKTYEVAATKSGGPHVQVSTMPAGRKLPQTESFLTKYALKLTLGAKDGSGNIPGTIYLCTPDSGKSFLAGTFTAKGK
jgi:hypothetical protein